MKRFHTLWLTGLAPLLGVLLVDSKPLGAQDDQVPTWSNADLDFFERHVRPLLLARCYECHSGESDSAEGGLRLETRADLLRGGDSGPAVIVGKPEESLLMRAVRHVDPLLQMPPDEPLSADDVAALAEWIRRGVPDPRTDTTPSLVVGPAQELGEHWWAFQPLRSVSPPHPDDRNWALNEIDYFVLARLEAASLSPAPPSARGPWLRRAYFDLIGLPPTPTELQAFQRDLDSNAFSKVVDRLLGSHDYGLRWGRHWLDVVRYADTSGCNGDFPLPEAYRYRNYVLESFNKDKPYDQFVREQLAGDLLDHATDQERFEHTIATGYLAISRRFSSLAEEFHLTLDDTIDNFGKAFMGLSLSCARCHSHKFDPIPQEDYYALYGIFQSTQYAFPGTEIYRHTNGFIPLEPRQRIADELGTYLDRMRAMDDEIYRVYSTMAAKDTGAEKNKLKAQWNKLKEQRDQLIEAMPAFEKAFAVSDGEPVAARLHIKGDPEKLGPEIARGFLQLLGGHQVPSEESGSGRLQLAQWLTEASNPLTARVIVNRIWQYHFGQALVRSPNDFGTRGQPPTHPDLLDYLAQRFIQSGWSIKQLHRLIMNSQTYRMASVEHPEYAEQDPENRLLWTFARRRLSAESIRDAMLSISGSLDTSMGGPHPFPPEVKWRYTQHRPFVDDYPTRRRSVFMMQQRIRQQPYLAVFDGADTNVSTGQRKPSTTPQQALFMMNSEFIQQQSERFAERLRSEADAPSERLRLAFRMALARDPSDGELTEGLEYVAQFADRLQRTGKPQDPHLCEQAAWASYLRVVLSSNEFVFVD